MIRDNEVAAAHATARDMIMIRGGIPYHGITITMVNYHGNGNPW